ncbi:uncharacterized protein ACB058_006824 [Synchiropus picturatus]
MGGKSHYGCCLFLFLCVDTTAFKIQNKLLSKCLQVQDSGSAGRVSLGDCDALSLSQEWDWHGGNRAIRNDLTGECLTASGEEFEGVHLQPCVSWDETESDSEEMERSSQRWSCSKKGHLTLSKKGLHLSAAPASTLVFVSREHKQGSRWRTLDSQNLCNGKEDKHSQQDQPQSHGGKSLEPETITDLNRGAQRMFSFETSQSDPAAEVNTTFNVPLPSSAKSPADPTMVFFSMDYGMSWKITMLVLSSLALVLGTVILILNVYSNRRKKVVCVLKSYSPRPEMCVPGSPAASERARLTEHAMRPPNSTPVMQRGEILIEWKDGTVTPLYEA